MCLNEALVIQFPRFEFWRSSRLLWLMLGGQSNGRLYIKSDSPSLYEWSEVRGQRLSDELMVNGASKC